MVKLRRRDLPVVEVAIVEAPPVIDTTKMEAEIAALRQEIASLRAGMAPSNYQFDVKRDALGKITTVSARAAAIH